MAHRGVNRKDHIRLKKPLQKALAAGHPWIFRQALHASPGPPGQIVTVTDSSGRFVARGISDSGPIAVRVFTTKDEPLDRNLLARRIQAAAALRSGTRPPDTDAFRLLHGEGDRLPGIVCDIYAAHAVLKFDGQGLNHHRNLVTDVLKPVLEDLDVGNLLLRSGRQETRDCEAVFGGIPDRPVEISEHGMKLKVDLVHGQKTGMFLDHRESRLRVRQISGGLNVLNLYGYTGGFSVAAGLGGCESAVTVDIAPQAIDLAGQNWELNRLDSSRHKGVVTDVASFMQKAGKNANGKYDLIVADPPSFAPREASVAAALKAYGKIHRSALGLLPPGGYYLAASCSSHVNRRTFEKTLEEGARRARRVIQVLQRWGAPPDHPRLLAFPEGDYLKVVLARVAE
jgi:23S rRNA (cytosine1962-C5)-methyltransferase